MLDVVPKSGFDVPVTDISMLEVVVPIKECQSFGLGMFKSGLASPPPTVVKIDSPEKAESSYSFQQHELINSTESIEVLLPPVADCHSRKRYAVSLY
jgi:hypothetical protein